MSSKSSVVTQATLPDRFEPVPGVLIHALVGKQTSHVVVWRGRSVLVECHSAQMPRSLRERGLPTPEMVLHTHVQPEHCQEGGSFPDARIFVHRDLAELASDPQGYRSKLDTGFDKPEEWTLTFGQETYGVAGSVTMRPPPVPLKVTDTFVPGDRIVWRDELAFEVVDLPGHGRDAVGFLLRQGDRKLAFFCGDLLCHGAQLVNVYDLEIKYTGTRLPTMPALLEQAAQIGTDLFLPATGPAIPDGPAQARTLAGKIQAHYEALKWTTGTFTPEPPRECRKVGRYLELMPGLFQINNSGNCILFIDDSGRGMMVDPGPCDYESPARRQNFINDLAFFERECGLKEIDLTLVTHIHGDHYDMWPLVKQRYPACKLAAWDLVARVIQAPWDFPYPALLPWYKLGLEFVKVDHVLQIDAPFHWHDIAIESLHLPGHCLAHGGHLLTWRGQRIALTGDTIQSRGGSSTLSYSIANHSVPDEGPQGCIAAFEAVACRQIDLNVGGHSSHFWQCAPLYRESLARMRHALPSLKALVPNGDLRQAFVRPWY